jgi:hypothetical protein
MKQRLIGLLIVSIFASAAIFGFAVSFSSDEMGSMNHCPFMESSATICPMSVFEHINAWQVLFSAIIPLLVLAYVQIICGNNISIGKKKKESSPPHRRTNTFLLFMPTLTEAFSSGTLHSKIYA